MLVQHLCLSPSAGGNPAAGGLLLLGPENWPSRQDGPMAGAAAEAAGLNVCNVHTQPCSDSTPRNSKGNM